MFGNGDRLAADLVYVATFFCPAERHCFIQNQLYWFANAVIVQNLIRWDNHRAQNQSGFRKSAGCFLAFQKQPALFQVARRGCGQHIPTLRRD